MSVRYVAIFSVISALSAFVSFLFLPLVTRLLSANEFASYSLALSSLGVLASSMLMGMPALYSSNWPARAGAVLSYFLSWSCVFFVVLTSVVAVVAMVFDVWWGWVVVVLLAVSKSIFMFAQCHYRLEKNVPAFVFAHAVFLFGSYASLCMISMFTEVSAIGFLMLMLASYFIANISFLKRFKPDFSLARGRGEYFRYCAFAFLHSLVASMVTVFDRFVVSAFLEGEALASYMLAAMLVSMISLAGSIINQNLTPVVYGRIRAGLGIEGYFLAYAMVIAFGVLAFNVLLPYVFNYLFPRGYLEAVDLVLYLCFGVFFQCLYFFVSTILSFYRRSDWIFYTSLCVGGGAALASYMLAEAYGVMGVLMAHGAAWALYFVVICGFVYGCHYKTPTSRA